MAKKKEKAEAEEVVETEEAAAVETEPKEPAQELSPFAVLADLQKVNADSLAGKVEMINQLASGVQAISQNDSLRFKMAMKAGVVKTLCAGYLDLVAGIEMVDAKAEELRELLAQLRNTRPVPPK